MHATSIVRPTGSNAAVPFPALSPARRTYRYPGYLISATGVPMS